MNKFNQWLYTAPTWQFLAFLIAEVFLLFGALLALHGTVIMITVK